jgi:hypothetical protein
LLASALVRKFAKSKIEGSCKHFEVALRSKTQAVKGRLFPEAALLHLAPAR